MKEARAAGLLDDSDEEEEEEEKENVRFNAYISTVIDMLQNQTHRGFIALN